MKTRILVIITIALVCIPGIYFALSAHNEVMVDGITVSAFTVWNITIILSFVSWLLLSWAAKNIKEIGIFLSIIMGASLVGPFVGYLGPMAAIIVGVTAGCIAFMLQKYITNIAKKKFLIIGIITITAAYCVLIIIMLVTQPTHEWHFANYIGGGAIDMDPDLSPSYAFDFAFGAFYYTILPFTGLFLGISALFLVPYFILKRKNIPSKPYLALILAGLLLFVGIPSFPLSLHSFAIMSYQPESIPTWIFNIQFVVKMMIPIIVLAIAGILLYRSSVIRRLINHEN